MVAPCRITLLNVKISVQLGRMASSLHVSVTTAKNVEEDDKLIWNVFLLVVSKVMESRTDQALNPLM